MHIRSAYSREALQEHKSKTNGHAVSNTLLEELLELRLLAHAVCTALLYLDTDLAHLALDVRMRRIQVTKLRQDPFSSIKVVAAGQPPVHC